MNFGRISTSKCRGKLQKMGVLYTHSPKSPGLFPKLPKIHFFKIKKFQKNWDSLTGASVDPWLAGDRWSSAGPGPPSCGRRLLIARLPATNGQGSSRPGNHTLTAGRCPQVGGLGPTGDQWSSAGHESTLGPVRLFPFFLNFFSSCLPFFTQVVNSFSLAATHACPA
jgi:hypothetical protein